MMKLVFFTIACALLVHVANAMTDSFENGCMWEDAKLRNVDEFGTYCLTGEPGYQYNYTMISLRKCFANKDGVLVAAENGNMVSSCRFCFIEEDYGNATVYLGCHCAKPDGTLNPSRLNLNDTLFNIDGALACYSVVGKVRHADPDLEEEGDDWNTIEG